MTSITRCCQLSLWPVRQLLVRALFLQMLWHFTNTSCILLRGCAAHANASACITLLWQEQRLIQAFCRCSCALHAWHCTGIRPQWRMCCSCHKLWSSLLAYHFSPTGLAVTQDRGGKTGSSNSLIAVDNGSIVHTNNCLVKVNESWILQIRHMQEALRGMLFWLTEALCCELLKSSAAATGVANECDTYPETSAGRHM